MKKLFGTDGIRGIAGEFPLDKNTIFVIGQSLAQQFREKHGRNPRFITGRDTRESGAWIEKAFHAGVLSQNGEAQSASVITTPGVAFLTKEFDFDAGIVISASHNPFQDNGLKVFTPDGKKINETIEREVEKSIFNTKNENFDTGNLDKIDDSRAKEFQTKYLELLAKEFELLSLKGLRIILDCANGASFELAPKLFKMLGGEVISINNQPNGANINADCGSTHISGLQLQVIENNADIGIAFDGDADRSLFVNEKGQLVDGDATLWAMAQHFQSHNNLSENIVVATVMSNIGLEIALNSKKISLIRTDVGDKYVLKELLEKHATLGGEQSGHIFFPKKSLVGDGMRTALVLLEAMQESGKSLLEITEGFTTYPQVLVNVKVAKKIPFSDVEKILEASKNVENELGSDGRLLLRYSGTENLARVMIEGKDQVIIDSLANGLAAVIKNELN
jgi:phosphoglucosamine mutase